MRSFNPLALLLLIAPHEMSTAQSPDSPTLVQRIVQGESAALEEVYDKFGTTVHAVALRVLHEPGEAEEVVQDTFKSLWSHAASLAEREFNLAAWLITAARRRAIDVLRRRRRRIPNATDLGEADAARVENFTGSFPTAGEAMEQRESAARVREAMSILPAEQAEVVRLSFFSGLTHLEIAEKLNQPLGTVKSRLRYALTKLQSKMGGLAHD
ncbi:sigma-70 family RNA polymerase sigma factor [Synoicihabitans lomoniglobus]|uniref:Sigma-70 family RNA polymerase sigma factor n=2 Tax=Synoicihabitans lomoniglobus TaxID=2909285 RepID=A0AAF0CPC0_9BACT|nr:sigma-70 family RNA polymerase sigma factor [Opitutaceae bacterium LMO-M01]